MSRRRRFHRPHVPLGSTRRTQSRKVQLEARRTFPHPHTLRTPLTTFRHPLQAAKLEELLSKPVTFLPDCVGEEVENAVKNAKDGEIFLLENLRFHAEEEGSSKDSEGKKTKGTSVGRSQLMTVDE